MYNFIKFIKTEMWDIHKKNVLHSKSQTIRHLKIVILSFRGFRDNKSHIRASALTYYTLLSIVPVFALVFAISKGFGFEQTLQLQLQESFKGHEEILTQVITFSHNLLNKTQGGLIAGIGVIVLLWSIIKLLSNIEHSFNTIWKINVHRSYVRKFADYLSIALICPLLFILSGSLTVYIATKIAALAHLSSAYTIVITSFTPYFLVWILFSFIYLIMPNCRVKIKSAVTAGIIAGTIIEFIQWLYLHFQIGVTSYNAIYGSFAALPLFLVLVQISWMTVLFGAEISFVIQNIEDYEFNYSVKHISYKMKKIISIRIISLIVRNFCEDLPPLTFKQILHKLEIPILLTRELLDELVRANIIVKVSDESTKMDFTYLPAHSVDKITISYVIKTLNSHKDKELPIIESNELETIKKCLSNFSDIIENSSSNILLKDIL
jgi:membrane protein